MSEAEARRDGSGTTPELAGLLLREETISGLLDVVVSLAVSGLVSLQGASVSLVTGHAKRLETTSATSELIRVVDEAQYEGNGGPCVEAIRTGQEVTMVLPADRWPVFGERALQAGVRSVWSLPLQVRERTTGALNLYSMVSEPWGDPAASVARELARQAAIVLANAADLMSAELANQHLRDALESRDLIGQAKGYLMAREGITADQAFDILRRASQRTGRKLRDIAAELVVTVATPEG